MLIVTDTLPHLSGDGKVHKYNITMPVIMFGWHTQLGGLVQPHDGGCYLSKTTGVDGMNVWEYNKSTLLVS